MQTTPAKETTHVVPPPVPIANASPAGAATPAHLVEVTPDGTRVHDRWGRELDGDGDGAAGGDRADGFHRLFGDGDGDTDPTDFERFLASFLGGPAGCVWYFDADADGDVDGLDMAGFNQRRRR